MCLDATRSYSCVGRLLNHAPRNCATLIPYKPLQIAGAWRVGFTAVRDLSPGTELTWDYGCQPGGLEWLKRRSGKKECKFVRHSCCSAPSNKGLGVLYFPL